MIQPPSTQPAQPAQPRDRTDRDELIRRHLPLAYRLAACYRGFERSYQDLVETAELGLIRAAEQFDPGPGTRFDAFAAPIITGELRRSLPECDSGRGRSRTELRPSVETSGAQRRIAGALGRSARVHDLARLLAVDTGVVAEALLSAAGREAVTLNLPVPARRTEPDGGAAAPWAA